jgi:hypothetical protein
VGARGGDPRDVACLPLDRGVAGGLEWFGGQRSVAGSGGPMRAQRFFIFRAGCALLLFFSRLKRISGVGKEIPNLAQREKERSCYLHINLT